LTNATLTLTSDERADYEASLAERERHLKAEQDQKGREANLEKQARRVLQMLVGVFLVAALIAGGLAYRAPQAEQAAQLNLLRECLKTHIGRINSQQQKREACLRRLKPSRRRATSGF
jgi:hypothetical protein